MASSNVCQNHILQNNYMQAINHMIPRQIEAFAQGLKIRRIELKLKGFQVHLSVRGLKGSGSLLAESSSNY